MTNMGLNYDLTEQKAVVTPTCSLVWPGTDLVLHMTKFCLKLAIKTISNTKTVTSYQGFFTATLWRCVVDRNSLTEAVRNLHDN